MKTIYMKLLFFLLAIPLGALAQGTLSGTVVDMASGEPLPGVNVVVEGSNNGAATDFDGKFTLTNVKSGETVVFTYIGYVSQTLKYSGQTDVTISLEEDANLLSEVVVQVGYGTVRRKDATGAVATVTTEDFNKGANVTVENLLNGRVAGLTINTSGAPGSGSTIRIRGGSSLNASNDPLIVIDGLPITNTTNTGSTSVLASLNPNDIESFTILKDASATAIYGSRASNGVIIITTKKGGKNLSVDYNFTYGSGTLVDKIDVFSASQFREIIGVRMPDRVADLGTANTDWQERIYRRTDYIDNNLSLRGNLFGVIPTRLSLGNTYQEGLRLTNTFNRNTVSLAMNPSMFKDHLKFRVSANYAHETNRFAEGVEGDAIRFDPTQPVYDPTSPFQGFFEYYNPNTGETLLGTKNPVARLLQTHDTGINKRIFGNFEVDYKFHFLPELRAVVNLGFDESNGERTKRVQPGIAASGPQNAGVLYGTNEFSEKFLRNKLLDTYLNYTKGFGNMNVDVTAGYSYQKFEGELFRTNNTFQPNYAAVGTETETDTDVVLIGFFGRANLTFNDKYLLTLSYRRDGSSRFSEENRWGNFPAAAFAWKLRDDLFKDSNTVSDLKLRLGYGITGQQDIPNANFYLQQYQIGNNQSQYFLGPVPYPIAVSSAYDPKLKWEETTTYNVGLDVGLFSRVEATVDAFYKISDDLLVNTALPDGGNFSNRGPQNIGSLTIKGLELGINADIVKSERFNWNVNFNFTTYQRRIDKLDLDSDILLGDTGAGTGGTVQIHAEGFTPYSFYVYKQLYNNDGQPIEGAFADLTGDGIINGEDRYIYKNPDPDATFGFASNLNYGNFDFSFNLRASIGNRVFNAVNAGRAQYDFLRNDAVLGNIPTSVLDTDFNTTANVVLSDIYIENASFLRLDNVTLGYTFPDFIGQKASLRLFAGVQNVFVLTEYSGLDPEITNDGRDNTIYPRQRSILFGANIKF